MGRIDTVPDGAGRSVTVSNWGVAQTSRHPAFRVRFAGGEAIVAGDGSSGGVEVGGDRIVWADAP